MHLDAWLETKALLLLKGSFTRRKGKQARLATHGHTRRAHDVFIALDEMIARGIADERAAALLTHDQVRLLHPVERLAYGAGAETEFARDLGLVGQCVARLPYATRDTLGQRLAKLHVQGLRNELAVFHDTHLAPRSGAGVKANRRRGMRIASPRGFGCLPRFVSLIVKRTCTPGQLPAMNARKCKDCRMLVRPGVGQVSYSTFPQGTSQWRNRMEPSV